MAKICTRDSISHRGQISTLRGRQNSDENLIESRQVRDRLFEMIDRRAVRNDQILM